MPTPGFAQNSVLSSGGKTFKLGDLIKVPAGATLPATLVVSAYDRDVYAGAQTFDYGHFSSPGSGTISAGNQFQPTLLYFDLVQGQYVARATGEALSAFTFTSSTQNYRSVYLSLATSATAHATIDSTWTDPAWQHLADLNIVTRTDYVDPTPNAATPEEIAAIAKSFIGKVWNDHGCWLLTSNISAAAGASLPVASARLDLDAIGANGQWSVVFNGARQHDDWRALLQVGDIVELGYINGQAHIATVTSGSGHGAMWVDNSGPRAANGSASDIVIQDEHSVEAWTANAAEGSVVVFRLNGTAPTSDPVVRPVAAPVVTPHAQSLQVGHALSVAALFSVQDPNLLPMTSYQITDLNGSAHLALNGAVNLATAQQQAAGVVLVSAADLARLTYTATLGPDQLTISAFNGQASGSANVTVTGWTDPPPVVTGSSVAPHATSQALAVAGLFHASSPSGLPITAYRIEDTTHTGQLMLLDPRVNLATNEEAAHGIYRVSAADLGSVVWRVLTGSGTLAISAFDGVQWSDSAAVTIAGQNQAPTVLPTARANLEVGQPVALDTLFTTRDADGDAVRMVTIYDFYDNVQLNGATDYCPFPHAYEVSVDQLSKVTYTPTSLSGLQQVMVSAYDGTDWSPLTSIGFTVADPAPVVQAASASVDVGATVNLAALFKVIDPNGKAIVQYLVKDPAGGGQLHLNGATNLADPAQTAQGYVLIAAADLGRLTYTGAAQAGSEPVEIRAFNGSQWGGAAVSVYSGSPGGAGPYLFAPAVTLDVGRTVALTELVTAYTRAGTTATEYRIADPAGGGTVELNGAHNLSSTAGEVLVAAADLSKLTFRVGATEGQETLTVAAYDGSSWGQAELLVTAHNYGRPVVTPHDVTVHAGQALALHDLFSAADPSGKTIVAYQVNDDGQHLQLNGAVNVYANEQYKGVYGFAAGDLDKVSFVADRPGEVTLYVEASNGGSASSMMEQVHVTVLSNPVITPTTATVNVHQSVALASLFASANPSGQAITQFRIDAGALHGVLSLNGAANLASAADQAEGVVTIAAADLPRLSYTGAASYGTDVLKVAAWDGSSWGEASVPVTTIDGTPPQVSAHTATVEVNSTIAAASLFDASTHSGQAISQYRIVNPNGGGKLVLNGAVNHATADDYAQHGTVLIDAADLGKLQYVGAATAGSETLTVAAFDGQSWGTAYLPVASVKTAPPVVTPQQASLQTGQAVGVAALFAVTDPQGAAITDYVFQDSSGNLQLNGAANLWAAQQANGYYWISAADIGRVTYQPGADGVFRYNVLVSDGLNFSAWTSGLVVAGADHLTLPPAVTPATATLALGSEVPVATLFAASDPLGNPLTAYSFHDGAGGGTLALHGAVDLASASQQAAGVVVVAAADLAKVTYRAAGAAATDVLRVGAFDGVHWGEADIAVTSASLPPTVHAAADSVEINDVTNVASLFAVTAASGAPVSQYRFQDPAGAGTLLLNGATDLATPAQHAEGVVVVSALDLDRVQYAAAASATSETLLIGAWDGKNWGTSNIRVETVDDRAPLIAVGAPVVDTGSSIALDQLFSAFSVSGHPVVEYLIKDPAGGGTVKLNSAHNLASAAQQSAGITVVAAYDLANMLYTGGTSAGSEGLEVTAFDGQHSTTRTIEVASVSPVKPVLATTPVTIHVGDAVRVADLISIADPNGHPIQFYRVLDMDLGINLNGAANLAVSPYYDYHGIYDFNTTSEFNKIEYLGQSPGTVTLTFSIGDGFAVSNTTVDVTVVPAGTPIAPPAAQAVAGGAADDTIRLTSKGNHVVDGQGGIDTVAYDGASTDFVLAMNADGSVTVHAPGGQTDTLRNVERIHFSDQTLAVDLHANQAADGSALAGAGQVYRLYQAAFDRTPDRGGLSFWIGQADHHASLTDIAAAFTSSAEFRDLYGGLTDHQFIEQLYQNVLHRGADAGGLAFWNGQLDHHATTREQVLVSFAESTENQAALIGVLQHGISYAA